MNPIISILMAYRGRPETDTSLLNLYESVRRYFVPKSLEILVRIDSDDLYGKTKINEMKDKFADIVETRIFSHNRWEGRWSVNYDYQFLFPRTNENSKFVGFITDDSIFTRNFLGDLERYKDTNYIILGWYPNDLSLEDLRKIDYKSVDWLTTCGKYTCAYPVTTKKLIETIGNMGWQVNIDSSLALLNIIMAQRHGIILSKKIEEFIERRNVEREDFEYEFLNRQTGQILHFNHDINLDSSRTSQIPYYFKLIEQQVKNIYLNHS